MLSCVRWSKSLNCSVDVALCVRSDEADFIERSPECACGILG